MVPVLEYLERQLVLAHTDEITGRKILHNPVMEIPKTGFDEVYSQMFDLVKNLNALSSRKYCNIL